MVRARRYPCTSTYLVICDLVAKSSDLIDRRTSIQPRYWKPKTQNTVWNSYSMWCQHHIQIYMTTIVISFTEVHINNSKQLSCVHIRPTVHSFAWIVLRINIGWPFQSAKYVHSSIKRTLRWGKLLIDDCCQWPLWCNTGLIQTSGWPKNYFRCLHQLQYNTHYVLNRIFLWSGL